uniref:Uncharacterized protein n=1 Tax=Tetraselmis sp. GSL018 TaxID=582737 RepID=A0A061RP73_9CHLO
MTSRMVQAPSHPRGREPPRQVALDDVPAALASAIAGRILAVNKPDSGAQASHAAAAAEQDPPFEQPPQPRALCAQVRRHHRESLLGRVVVAHSAAHGHASPRLLLAPVGISQGRKRRLSR